MIIISASCRKSASTLIFDYQRDMVQLAENKNGQLRLQKFSTGKGYRGKLDIKTFLLLIYINFKYGSVVLKTHSGPTFFVRLLVNLGLAKVTYSYRDPRDVVLSMIDHGTRTRKELKQQEKSIYSTKGFADIYSIEDALSRVREEIKNWYLWSNFKDVLLIKYESFVPNKLAYIKKIANHLGYHINDRELNSIHQKYSANSRNFNKGVVGRYTKEMNDKELKSCEEIFQVALKDMGYILEKTQSFSNNSFQ